MASSPTARARTPRDRHEHVRIVLHRLSSESADPPAERMLEWRAAAKRVGREWNAWLAADRDERAAAYTAYVDALSAEEVAAAQAAGV
jgi:hypothetical protein